MLKLENYGLPGSPLTAGSGHSGNPKIKQKVTRRRGESVWSSRFVELGGILAAVLSCHYT